MNEHAFLERYSGPHVELTPDDQRRLEYFENLYWCGFLPWRIGQVEDVIRLWRAKNIDFDTGCGFDIQMLVGAGVDQTIEYLRTQNDPEAAAALAYIVDCKAGGQFDELEEWATWRSSYFGGDVSPTDTE